MSDRNMDAGCVFFSMMPSTLARDRGEPRPRTLSKLNVAQMRRLTFPEKPLHGVAPVDSGAMARHATRGVRMAAGCTGSGGEHPAPPGGQFLDSRFLSKVGPRRAAPHVFRIRSRWRFSFCFTASFYIWYIFYHAFG